MTLRALGAEDAARAALPFLVLLPGRGLGRRVRGRDLRRGDRLGVALLAARRDRPRPAADWRAGRRAAARVRLYLSYGLVLVGLLAAGRARAARRSAGRGCWPAPAVAAVVVVFTAAGFWWFDGYARGARSLPGSSRRTGRTPTGCGPTWPPAAGRSGPAVVAGLRRRWPAVRAALPRGRASALAAAGAGRRSLVADLSGLSKAEVERIWLPFAVWLLVAAARCSPATGAGGWPRRR